MARGESAALLGGAGRFGIRRAGEPPSATRKGRPQDLAELREQNRRRARLIRKLRRIDGYGPRAGGELAIELALRLDALPVLKELAQQLADRLDPDLLRAIGCADFPALQSVLSPEVGDDDEIALGMGSFRCLDDWGSTMALWIITGGPGQLPASSAHG